MLLGDEREQVIEYSLKMVSQQLSQGSQGNISILNYDKKLFAISPSSMDYHAMTPADVVIVDLDGNIVDGARKPSVEIEMHRIFYRSREDVGAVVHTHSLYATAYSTLGRASLPAISNMITFSGGPELKCTPYIMGGSLEIAQTAYRTMGTQRAVLLGNHGVLTAGRDIDQAFVIAEEMEFLARIYLLAKCAGEPVVIDPSMLRFRPGW